MKTFARICICVAVLLFCSGCATSALWEEGKFSRFREPCTPSHLQLFKSPEQNKVLVVYDEENEDQKSRKRRAYWAETEMASPPTPFRPQFVRTNVAKTLPPIPLTAVPSATGLSATPENDSHAFVLFRDGMKIGFYELPVYDDKSGRAKQVVLTPLAVAADATIVGGIAAVAAAYYYAGGSGGIPIWVPSNSETK